MKDPILITGAARSGTSMVAGIISLCGAFGGEMSGITKHNAKGMFENAQIRNKIMKPYLSKLEVDPLGQYHLPDIATLPIETDWKERVENVLKIEGYQGGQWMYKGAKMCLTWKQWYYAFPDAKWIIVRRRTGDIITSCIKTGFMRAFQKQENQEAVGVTNERDGWKWWVHQHEQRFIEMITQGLNVKVVWPERMVSGNYKQMMETMEWLGLEWNDEVYKFIEPKLWKARQKKKGV